MTATDTDIDLSVLEDLEFSPPCEVTYPNHPRCPNEATYAVTFKNPLPCGCRMWAVVQLMCSPHWEEFIGKGARCIDCGYSYHRFLDTVERCVPIRGGSGG